MATDRHTTIIGNQIKDATVTEDELNTSVAGVGITGGAGTALALDFNELSDVSIDVANDSITILDATDSSSKRETVAALITAIAGVGLTDSAGVLALDLNELPTESTFDPAADFTAIVDATDDGSDKTLWSVIGTAIAGTGIVSSNGVLALDLNELNTEATFDPAADFLPMVDATDSSSDKALWSVIATAIAGTGITATNGVLSADSVSDNIVEADISKDDFTSTLDGALTDFDLTSIPLANSLQVYINGVYAREGAANDYELNPDSGDTKTIRINGDVLASTEKLVVHYIIDN